MSEYERAVPDAPETLGGLKEGKEPDHPSVIGHLVKSLMPGQDLTRVTIPAFFLEPRSLLERMADTMMHPDLLLGVSKLEDPVARMKGIVQWYLSGFHYKTLGVKKPYNPVIGETFACAWDHADGSRSQYFAEQVLHRPPISATYFENRAANVSASAHVWTRSQFSAPQTTKSILDGACVLTLTNLGEEYWITFPTYYAHNLLLGKLRMEVGDTGTIVCRKTGLRCDVDFQQLTLFGSSERLRSIEGRIYRTTPAAGGAQGKGEELFSLSGHWDSVINIAPRGGAAAVFLDLRTLPVAPKRVLPLEEQGPWESRRLWQHATKALLVRPKVDWDAVDREKGQLEEEQRLLPCHAKAGSPAFKEWPTKRFKLKKVVDGITGAEREIYFFTDAALAPYVAGEAVNNLLALSRDLPDPRGGRDGAGAEDALATAMRSIKLSSKRQQDWGAAAASASGGSA